MIFCMVFYSRCSKNLIFDIVFYPKVNVHKRQFGINKGVICIRRADTLLTSGRRRCFAHQYKIRIIIIIIIIMMMMMMMMILALGAWSGARSARIFSRCFWRQRLGSPSVSDFGRNLGMTCSPTWRPNPSKSFQKGSESNLI